MRKWNAKINLVNDGLVIEFKQNIHASIESYTIHFMYE